MIRGRVRPLQRRFWCIGSAEEHSFTAFPQHARQVLYGCARNDDFGIDLFVREGIVHAPPDPVQRAGGFKVIPRGGLRMSVALLEWFN